MINSLTLQARDSILAFRSRSGGAPDNATLKSGLSIAPDAGARVIWRRGYGQKTCGAPGRGRGPWRDACGAGRTVSEFVANRRAAGQLLRRAAGSDSQCGGTAEGARSAPGLTARRAQGPG